MIHRARFQNFKALKDVEITFDSQLTVLVGPNGSGKSSVLRGIYWLCQMAGHKQEFDASVQEVMRNAKGTYSGETQDQLFEVMEICDTGDSGIRFRTHPNSKTYPMNRDGKPPLGERWECISISPSGDSFRHPNIPPHVQQSLGLSFLPAQFVQLDARRLSDPTLTEETPPVMTADGRGLASLMAYFKLYDEPRFNQVVELFQKIIPQVRRIRIDRIPVNTASHPKAMGEGLVFDLPGRNGTPASAMSDGTLYALGLIVKILDPQRPKTLLIDDIDHGFHPKAQLTLVELLHKLLEEIPDLQIIATSHSPYILSGLEWDEVRVTGLREDGSAVIRPLTAHPNYEKWKESMSPGEFWSHAGEDWVIRQEEKEAVAR